MCAVQDFVCSECPCSCMGDMPAKHLCLAGEQQCRPLVALCVLHICSAQHHLATHCCQNMGGSGGAALVQHAEVTPDTCCWLQVRRLRIQQRLKDDNPTSVQVGQLHLLA